MNRSLSVLFSLLLLASAATGCKAPVCHLEVTEQKTMTSLPALISTIFTVDKVCLQGKTEVVREHLTELDSLNFELLEDGQKLSPYESHPGPWEHDDKRFKVNTLLALDLSGSILSANALEPLRKSATQFIAASVPELGEHYVSIQAFDGRRQLYPLTLFTNQKNFLESILMNFECNGKYLCVDDSTNLYGAVINALGKLEMETGQYQVNNLVLFTDGTDRAGYYTLNDAIDVIGLYPKTNIFGVALGGELRDDILASLAKNGAERASDASHLSDAFEKIANALKKETHRYYKYNYCSPSRFGRHELKVIVKTTETFAGKPMPLEGSFTSTFDATDFGAGCNPDSAR